MKLIDRMNKFINRGRGIIGVTIVQNDGYVIDGINFIFDDIIAEENNIYGVYFINDSKPHVRKIINARLRPLDILEIEVLAGFDEHNKPEIEIWYLNYPSNPDTKIWVKNWLEINRPYNAVKMIRAEIDGMKRELK